MASSLCDQNDDNMFIMLAFKLCKYQPYMIKLLLASISDYSSGLVTADFLEKDRYVAHNVFIGFQVDGFACA